MERVLINVNMKVENYITENESSMQLIRTVIILNNTKNINEKHWETFIKCPDVFWLLYLTTLQERKSQRLGISMRLDNICTQNAGEKLNEQMANLSQTEVL